MQTADAAGGFVGSMWGGSHKETTASFFGPGLLVAQRLPISRDDSPCIEQSIRPSHSYGQAKVAHNPHTRVVEIRIYRGFEGRRLRGKSLPIPPKPTVFGGS
jgi:hypothetical protein